MFKKDLIRGKHLNNILKKKNLRHKSQQRERNSKFLWQNDPGVSRVLITYPVAKREKRRVCSRKRDLQGKGNAELLEQCYLVVDLQPISVHERFVPSHKEIDTRN